MQKYGNAFMSESKIGMRGSRGESYAIRGN